MRSEHVSVVIRRPPGDVYAYAADPTDLPDWAAGLASGVRPTGDPGVVVTDSPMGTVRVRFTGPNPFGILDHVVTLPDGEVVHNPMRVLAHPNGCEVVFTLRQRGLTDTEFAADLAAVRADLERLRAATETPGGRLDDGEGE